MSLFLRLWMSLVLTFGLLILALGAAEYTTLQKALLFEVDENLRSRAEWVADELRQGRVPGGPMVPQGNTLEEVAKLFVEIVDGQGRRIASSNNLGLQHLPGQYPGGTRFLVVRTQEGRRLRVYQLETSSPKGLIRVAESLELVDRSLRHSLLRVAGLGLLAAVLAAGLAYRVLIRTLGPLFAVSQVARHIAETGDLSMPVPAQSAVAEVDQVARTLNSLLARVHELLEAQQRLLQDTSHELRNPLMVLQMDLEVLARPELDAEMRAEIAQEVQGELQRLIRLAQDLLLISWAESRPALQLESVRLDSYLERIVEKYQGLCGSRRLKVYSKPVWVKADPLRLDQIVRNLLDNAIRYTPDDGRISLWIRLESDEKESGPAIPAERLLPTVGAVTEQVTLIVQDNGCGIAPEYWDSLFERFFRIEPDRNRKAGGIGLGLPLARALARAMGGDLWVFSQPGRGSSFLLSLARDLEGGG